mmetsp:Transcript_26691/g.67622  ORF Transcript_26691/g.67622 Transcript_26691/m.67622 type:complete len:202 (+) Transcript_26691:505-1110(+)
MHKLLLASAEVTGADYVFLDLGPSKSQLNATFLMSCDFILPPCFPDLYSVASVYALLSEDGLLQRWITQHAELVHNQRALNPPGATRRLLLTDDQRRHGFAMKLTFPKLLPFIVTNFDPPRLNIINKADAGFIYTLKNLIEQGCTHVPAAVKSLYIRSTDMVLPLLQHIGAVHKYSHQTGVPIVSMSAGAAHHARQTLRAP